jgi:hypothetical protein
MGCCNLKRKLVTQSIFYRCEPKEDFILDEVANIIIINKSAAGWILIKEE